MSGRARQLAVLVAGALTLGGAPAQAAGPSREQLDATRLSGRFAMRGTVTGAVGVRGERPGERVSRTWVFAGACPHTPCRTVTLLRQRQSGGDALTLLHSGTGRYTGRAEFTLPLTCGDRRYARGVVVPFTITVVIEAVRTTGVGPVATQIRASYVSSGRRNETPCVLAPAHDGARYTGTLTA